MKKFVFLIASLFAVTAFAADAPTAPAKADAKAAAPAKKEDKKADAKAPAKKEDKKAAAPAKK